ncbi:MAG: glycosyltransferase family 39 protein [Elusimicrobiales bacterium]|nr:glycosyltransferase family 39 protein [Elusimicrobiales bacterium]
MSEDTDNLSPWRKKFLATRMTFESLLFEKELVRPGREKLSTGLIVLGAIWLFHALLLAQWAFRRGYFFNQADAESFGGVLRYAAYLKSQGFWALLKPEFSDLTLNPPLYYLSYVPVLNYLTSDLNLALIVVNSFYMLVLALAIFLAVRRSRPNMAGWFGAAFALAFPFVLETARRPAPEMALMALAAAVYACYIRSDEFEHPQWSFAFAVCLGLGFFSHRFFWLYALPLAPFIIEGFANPSSRDELFKGMLPGLVLNLPWYLFAIAAVAAGLVPLWGDYNGFWHYFKLGVSAAGLPLFLLGAAGLTWMYYSVFMPYEKKKVVAAWFWAPYLLLTWVVRGSHPQLLYPALLPLAIAVPVMTPHQARKYLLIFVLALGAVNQSGLVRSFGGKYPLAGLPPPPAGDFRSAELLALIENNAPLKGGLVGIYGDESLNSGALRFAATKSPLQVKFADSPACPACAFVLIHKTPRFGEKPSAVEASFAALKNKPWFPAVFDKKADLELNDTSRAEVYVKNPSAEMFLGNGTHEVRNLALGPLGIEDATLQLSGFDQASGVYASANLFAPAALLLGGDVYGLTLDISGLSAASASLNPFVPAGVGAVKVTSAKITEYAVERYLAERYPFLTDLKITLDDNLDVTALARGRRLHADFALSIKDGAVLEAKPLFFVLGPVTLSPYLLQLFTFRLDFSDNPYGIRVSGLRITKKMIELY